MKNFGGIKIIMIAMLALIILAGTGAAASFREEPVQTSPPLSAPGFGEVLAIIGILFAERFIRKRK